LRDWKIYTVTGSNNDVTTSIQGGTPVSFFASNGNGFLIACDRPFGLVGVNVSTADSGDGVFVAEYFNGSSFVTLTTIEVQTAYALGTKLHVFLSPIDWAVSSGITGVTNGLYCVRFRSTTAPSTTPAFNDAWVGSFITFREDVADNGYLGIETYENRPIVFEGQESLLPYFSGTANAANYVEGSFSKHD
jgi:hypothetical protein